MTENFDEYFRAGLSFFKNKDYQNAISSFLKAKTVKPDQCNIQFYLGESYSNIKDIRKALQAYTIGLLLCPDDVEIKTALIQVASSYSPSDKEELDLRNEILLQPDHVGNYCSLANKLLEKRDDSSLNESIELFETIIQLDPEDTASYMMLGIAYWDKGMIDEAIDINEKAVRIDPNYDEINNIFSHLDKLYKLKGNFSEMIKKYQTLLRDEKNKMDISYHFALAEAYLNNGDLLSAKEEFSKIPTNLSKKYSFIRNKKQEIDEKIKRIKSIEEKVNQFERKLRKFIEKISLKNNREICEGIEKSELFAKIQDKIQTEINKKPYLRKEDLNPLDYFQIYDYNKLIEMNWDIFKNYFVSKRILTQNIEYINDFRNQVKHNRIVDDSSIEFCIAALFWFDKIFNQQKM